MYILSSCIHIKLPTINNVEVK